MREIELQDEVILGKGLGQYILPGYEEEVAALLTEQKKRELSQFFTNPEGRVTAVIPGARDITAATLIARFSRAQEPDSTELYWKEFRQKLGADVANRILNEYGDDSVREEASAYVMFRGISVLTSLQIFRQPLISGIEASTRYINWSGLPVTEFAVDPKEIVDNPEARKNYWDAMNRVHETYRQLWPEVWDFVVANNPREEGQSEAAYKKAVKGATCDALRGLLPLGIRTSVGLHANYRTLSEMIMDLKAENFSEMREVADEAAGELTKINAPFISVVDSEHGKAWTDFKKRELEILDNVLDMDGQSAQSEFDAQVVVLNRDWHTDLVRAASLAQKANLISSSDGNIALKFARTGKLENLFKDLRAARTNRRHKLPAFFDVVSLRVGLRNLSFGAYKDLNRHRRWQCKSDPDWQGRAGFVITKEIEELGGEVKDKYVKCQVYVAAARQKLEKQYPEVAKLLLTHGTRTSAEVVMGLGELYWITELRSIASGNPEYRHIAVKLYDALLSLIPSLADLGGYVDRRDHKLGRIGEAVRADLKGNTST